MNRSDGAAIEDLAHIKQSITDILNTPVGSRVMRREFGSLVPDLLDSPLNDYTRMQLQAASVMAIMRWEPRISLTSLKFNVGTGDNAGALTVDFEGDRVDGSRSSSPVSASILLRGGTA